jgi:hypothetical protein
MKWKDGRIIGIFRLSAYARARLEKLTRKTPPSFHRSVAGYREERPLPMRPMTPLELEQARRRCSEAPPGPWHAAGDQLDDADGLALAVPAGSFDDPAHGRFCDSVVFLAAARTDLPAALDMIEDLEAEVGRLGQQVRLMRAFPMLHRTRSCCPKCGMQHRSWSTLAACVHQDAFVAGEGPHAVLLCPDYSGRQIVLFAERQAAETYRLRATRNGCCRTCRSEHTLVDLAEQKDRMAAELLP